MKYEINGHTIEFDRAAMTAAHQAFPLEFAEWNLALKLKGKATLPGVTVAEIGKPCMTDADKGPAVTREQVCPSLAPASPEPRPVTASAAGLKVFVRTTNARAVIADESGCYYAGQCVGAGARAASDFARLSSCRPATEAEAAKAFRDAWAEESGRKWLTKRGWKPEGEYPIWRRGVWEGIWKQLSMKDAVFYGLSGRVGAPLVDDLDERGNFDTDCRPIITEAEAIEWLRKNGHESVARELEGK